MIKPQNSLIWGGFSSGNYTQAQKKSDLLFYISLPIIIGFILTNCLPA